MAMMSRKRCDKIFGGKLSYFGLWRPLKLECPQLWSVAQKVDFLRQPKSFSLNFFAFLQAHT